MNHIDISQGAPEFYRKCECYETCPLSYDGQLRERCLFLQEDIPLF